jgi:hypothetical protein
MLVPASIPILVIVALLNNNDPLKIHAHIGNRAVTRSFPPVPPHGTYRRMPHVAAALVPVPVLCFTTKIEPLLECDMGQ